MDDHAALLSSAPSTERRVDLVLQLQRAYGNGYVQRLLDSMALQAKLTVNAPGDVYEQEADRVADAVVGATDFAAQRQPVEEEEEMVQPSLQRQEEEEEMVQPSLQRQEEEEEMAQPSLQRQEEEEEMVQPSLQRQEEEEEMVQPSLQRQEEEEEMALASAADQDQTATTDAVPLVAPRMEDRINEAKGRGDPLADNVRGPMERGFGADFSDVRVHTDAGADALSESLQARAFTTGQDIFFRSGEYDAASSPGRQLIAHELTHTLQQGGGEQAARLVDEPGASGDGIRPKATIQRYSDVKDLIKFHEKKIEESKGAKEPAVTKQTSPESESR
jgi:hypothetical protein